MNPGPERHNGGFGFAQRHMAEGHDRQGRRHEQQTGGDQLGRARADQAAEQARDDGAQKRQEDDRGIHTRQPFIMLTSSTAMVPRLRK